MQTAWVEHDIAQYARTHGQPYDLGVVGPNRTAEDANIIPIRPRGTEHAAHNPAAWTPLQGGTQHPITGRPVPAGSWLSPCGRVHAPDDHRVVKTVTRWRQLVRTYAYADEACGDTCPEPVDPSGGDAQQLADLVRHVDRFSRALGKHSSTQLTPDQRDTFTRDLQAAAMHIAGYIQHLTHTAA